MQGESEAKAWDRYWVSGHAGGNLYTLIAHIYRRFIIRPSLNHFISAHFPEGTRLIHAGCGSGEVDEDLRLKYKLVGVDISENALQLYKKNVGDFGESCHASILALPFEEASVSGIYNLGVVEHFTAAQISTILNEFYRVLKPAGKVVLFWPPQFGLSVRFLRMMVRFIKAVTGRVVEFHPEEVSLLGSQAEAEQFLKSAGLTPTEYYFGIRDLWTYAVVVGQKPGAETQN